MIDADPAVLLAAGAAVAIAGAGKAGLGGAGAFAATPLMTLVMSPAQAIGVMLPLLMAIDVATLGPYWRRWSWPDSRALMAGATLGLGFGWALYGAIPPDALKLAIGLVAVAFCLFRIAQGLGWSPPGDPALHPLKAGFWGAVAGLTSFVAHAGGPPAAMALIPRRLDKTVFQATTVIVFLWINVVKLGPYLALGLIDGANLAFSAALAPFAALGVVLGVVGHRRIPQRWFDRVMIATLLIAGGKLAADGIAALAF